MNTLDSSAEKLTGKVTPYGMENTLEEKYKATQDIFKRFLEESSEDLKETGIELDDLKKVVIKEKILSDTL